MMKSDTTPRSTPVQVRVRSIASFIAILEKEGLREAFFTGAPPSAVLPSGDVTTMKRLGTELFRGQDRVSPMDLSVMIDRYRFDQKNDLDEALVEIPPETMAYAVQFVESRGLTATYPLTAHLKNCRGGPVECPEGL